MTSPSSPPPRVPIGDWNHGIVLIGPQQCGKTTYAIKRARELARTPAIVIVHDVAYGFHGPDVQRHDTREELAAALVKAPGGLHCLDVSDGGQVLDMALAVARSAQTAAGGKRATSCTPVLFVEDEVVSFEGASANYLDKKFQKAYLMRRHLEHQGGQIGFIIGAQRPQIMHPTIYELCTELVIWRPEAERSIKAFEAAQVPDDVLAKVLQLRDHEYLVYRKGIGQRAA